MDGAKTTRYSYNRARVQTRIRALVEPTRAPTLIHLLARYPLTPHHSNN